MEKHINEGTIHRDMFDRLTRSLYDEISRESFSRFIKLFAPDKVRMRDEKEEQEEEERAESKREEGRGDVIKSYSRS